MYTIKDFLEVKTVINPSLSSDGKTLAYLSNLTGTFQIYTVPVAGGEPKQLTSYSNSVGALLFSPTRNEILFYRDTDGNEKYQIYILYCDTGEVKTITNNPEARYHSFQWAYDGNKILYSGNARNGVDFDIYVYDLKTDTETVIQEVKGYWYTQGFSPKGTYALFVELVGNADQNIYLYNFETKACELITAHTTPTERYSDGVWLPDESGFYVNTDKNEDFMNVSLYNIQEKTLKTVYKPTWNTISIDISDDGTKMAVIVNEGGINKLRVFSIPEMKEIEINIPHGTVSAFEFSKKDNEVLVSVSTACSNRKIYHGVLGQEYKIIASAPQGVPEDVMVEPELVSFKSFDGLEIPAFIYTPKNIDSGKKLPVIMHMHGGPEAQSSYGLISILQFFVYQGYVVVDPNVRGSDGYGKKYLALDDIEKRMDSVKDMVEVRNHLANLPYVDAEKIVLYGGSYGGFMVLAGLAFYPELFAAGVDVVGIANFVTFLENTALYRRSVREIEYGYLDKHKDLLVSISPIHKADQIKSPLMVIHGTNDPRVPLNEAEQIHEAVKKNGIETELLVYPDEGHGLAKLKNRLDAYPKMVDFLNKVLGK